LRKWRDAEGRHVTWLVFAADPEILHAETKELHFFDRELRTDYTTYHTEL